MFRDFLHNISHNTRVVFSGTNLIWHGIAIAITIVFVQTGLDWRFFESTRSDLFYWIIITAGVGDFILPIVVSVALYVTGEFRKNHMLMRMGAALAQASIIAIAVSSLYKVFTGRTQPEFLTHLSNVDISHAFHFGFLENGVYWGWPSSHVAVAFAAATALCILSRYRSIRVIALSYALYIGVGAAIGFHWLSDVLAGAIIGTLIGLVVGKDIAGRKGPRRGPDQVRIA